MRLSCFQCKSRTCTSGSLRPEVEMMEIGFINVEWSQSKQFHWTTNKMYRNENIFFASTQYRKLDFTFRVFGVAIKYLNKNGFFQTGLCFGVNKEGDPINESSIGKYPSYRDLQVKFWRKYNLLFSLLGTKQSSFLSV